MCHPSIHLLIYSYIHCYNKHQALALSQEHPSGTQAAHHLVTNTMCNDYMLC